MDMSNPNFMDNDDQSRIIHIFSTTTQFLCTSAALHFSRTCQPSRSSTKRSPSGFKNTWLWTCTEKKSATDLFGLW
jgi:hypothetical protein